MHLMLLNYWTEELNFNMLRKLTTAYSWESHLIQSLFYAWYVCVLHGWCSNHVASRLGCSALSGIIMLCITHPRKDQNSKHGSHRMCVNYLCIIKKQTWKHMLFPDFFRPKWLSQKFEFIENYNKLNAYGIILYYNTHSFKISSSSITIPSFLETKRPFLKNLWLKRKSKWKWQILQMSNM